MSNPSGFKAVFDTREILEWDKPQTYSRIFKVFKEWGNMSECSGILFFQNIPIRFTGKNKEFFRNYLEQK